MPLLPMFPLGSVLFPGSVLPLQIFEDRYRALVSDVLLADHRFGVVLIERGGEVGGGDVRSMVGTVAEIVRRGESEDGMILIAAIGRERIRVSEWLPDAPYPLAMVQERHETEPGPDLGAVIERCAATRRRLLALAIELGATGQALDLDLPAEPDRAAWALCAAAPVGAFDRQQLLEIDDPAERMLALERMLAGYLDDLGRVLRDSGESD